MLSTVSSKDFVETIKKEGSLYGPMNVIVYDGEAMFHYNNVTNLVQEMSAGIHCVSNATLNTPWPKLERMKSLVASELAQESTPLNLVKIGEDFEKPVDERLPSTGISIEMERDLSSIFVKREGYGTRCTTVVVQQANGDIEFIEQTFNEGEKGTLIREQMTV